MRLKLDENLGESIARILRDAGHDVETVFSQNLCSSSDHELIQVCKKEARCLVSLDMDFANPLRFPPSQYRGIVVLRLPARATLDDLKQLAATLAQGLQQYSVDGELWIVQKDRIRVYQKREQG
ncbi:MAG: DUF5615 family PIN-like protein [Armatimonadota bacterium]|nr:DUF5615 family PIN-like protein [bacterium]MDW8320415.1 DUF5615 family PIN-like protein [Armatimonadota bacterium]